MANHNKRSQPGPFELSPAQLTTDWVSKRKLAARDPRIQRALELLQQNYAHQNDDVAMTLNLSASRFRHLFKEELGISPHHYLLCARLHRARALLENSFLRVKEVAALVGVNDLSHFVRDYKMLFNETPPRRVLAPADADDESAHVLNARASSHFGQQIAVFANTKSLTFEVWESSLPVTPLRRAVPTRGGTEMPTP